MPLPLTSGKRAERQKKAISSVQCPRHDLKAVKAIGWYIEEYGIAQISMNLTNIRVTPVHIAFDEVCRAADARGIRVTGSELVGLIPLQSMLDAGRYFLEKQQRSTGVSEKELIRIAILSMGLDELGPFKPEDRIIEYLLRDPSAAKLVSLTLRDFADETASESPGSRRWFDLRLCRLAWSGVGNDGGQPLFA